MKKQTILALAITAIIVAVSAEPAMAYVLLSPRRTWASTPISVRVYTAGNSTINDGDGGVTATVGAIKAWSVVSSATTNQRAVRGSAPSTIELNNNGKICTGSCLAATLTGYYSGSTIYDADVYTNTRYSYTSSRETDGCSGEFDMDGIMVHEVGHVIGIGHSNVAGATMYPTVSSCNINNRTLEADDRAAMTDLY
ncbi:MAG TPA: matrixin family metalloprotease [Thermoanaerobaculia bacterium]|jgi:predicted Zn-dependent protease|nr:matrixin family metalloprotease [Thermoanaerobaculia bacterium]